VGIRKEHAFPSQAVDVGSGNPRLGIVASHVAVAEVVGQNEDHVGMFRDQDDREYERKEKEGNEIFHVRKIGWAKAGIVQIER
jgi:hypothetical protein